jgi:hypothetical protein
MIKIIDIVSLGLKPLYDRNILYFRIIKEFREKLPRVQNQATTMTQDMLKNNPTLSQMSTFVSVINLATHKVSLTESDIDKFYNQFNEFDYKFVFFKKHYKDFTRNLNRFNPKAVNGNFHLAIVQSLLKDNSLNPLKPLDIFVFRIKYEYRLSSPIYIWLKNRNNEKF